MDNSYFAAVPPQELAARILEKADDFYQTLRTNGRLELWQSAYQHYYGLDRNGRHVSAKPARDGAQAELVRVKASHVRNLVQHLVNLTAQSRVTWEARSLNTDHKSQTSCILGQQILDWYMRERQLERLFRQAAEYSSVWSEAYMVVDWDPEKGDPYAVDPQTGQVIKQGDTDVRVYLPIDIVREFYQDEDGRADWYIVRRYVSRHKLAAQFPTFAEQILNSAEESLGSGADLRDFTSSSSVGGSDRITVYTLYHDKCPQLEQGLKAIVAGGELIHYEPFPFRKFNVHRISTGEQVKTPYGYSSTFDLMGLNDIIDMLYSSVVSNNCNFAVQNIWTKPGAGLTRHDLGGGLQHLESAEKPEPIQLTASAPESYNLIKMLETLCETLSGVNSVARGNPDGALKGSSGSAMALLQSMTIQFASGLQQSYAQLVEQVGDTVIAVLQDHAQVPRLAAIVGQHNQSFAQEFKGSDLEPISRVVVDMGNPAAKTAAGRLQLADNLLQGGHIDADQYMMVLATGKLEPMTQGKQAQLLLVKKENEDLKKPVQMDPETGMPMQTVMAIMTDNHALHVQEHAAVLADPETRRQPGVVQAVLAHIQEHMDQARAMPPDVAMLTGQQPLPAPPMPGPGPGGQQGGPPPGPPGSEPGGQPALPVNPMTGEQAPGPVAA